MLQNTNPGDADSKLLKEAADSLEARIERGDTRTIEAVLLAYPSIALNREGVLELMYLEWVLRCERAELPSVEEYCNRFPEFAGDFEKLVRVDEVVRGVVPSSGVTLAEKAAIDFDPLTVQARDIAVSRPNSAYSISIGGYTLQRIIGRGGMGIVYEAKQQQLDRLVALKTIDFAGSLNPRTVARFRSEAELVARLQHPNIVQVYETGSHSGMPFFSMELVDGGTLANAITSGGMKPNLAARLVEVLARAIHYAHSQGIIHRDLKPANVLLARSDRAEALDLSVGSSESSGPVRYEPKIVDFGLAKLLGDTSRRTMSGMALGTPSYMAPEQLSSELGEVGPASDVYSLGAILYELLIGQPPFHAATAVETMQQVRLDEPSLPPSLRRKLPRDLVLICMTCLRKEPQQRYSSAADLADDLQRYLSGNPIQARPAGVVEMSLKWAKRHPSAAALLASITLATIGMTLLWWRAESSSTAERLERVRAENLVYARNISLAQFEYRSNKVEECEKLLSACPPALRNWEWSYLDALCDDTLWESPKSDLICRSIDISEDGRYLASCNGEWWTDDQAPISVWDLASGEKKWELPLSVGGVFDVSFSPDGTKLASAGFIWKKDKAGNKVLGSKVWNLVDGSEHLALTEMDSQVIRYSPDGRSIFVGLWKSGTVKQYDSETGQEIAEFKCGKSFITDIAFHSDGEHMAASSRDGQVRVWNVATKKLKCNAFNLPDPRNLAWQPGTNVLLVSCFDGEVKRFELVENRLKLLGVQGNNALPMICFSPDGQYLATSVFGETTTISDFKTGRTVNVLRGHNGHVMDITFDASGTRVVTSGTDGAVRVWDLKQHREYPVALRLTKNRFTAIASNVNKSEVALAMGMNAKVEKKLPTDETHRVYQVNLATNRTRKIDTAHTNWLTSVAYSFDGERLLTGSQDCTLNYLDNKKGKVLAELNGHSASIVNAAFIDEHRAISVDIEGNVRVWELESCKAVHAWATQQSSVVAAAFDVVHSRVLILSADGCVSIWRFPTGELLHRRKLDTAPSAATLSPSGLDFAIGDVTGRVYLWGVSQLLDENATAKHVINAHVDIVTSLSFSPDGTRLLTGGRDESMKLVDAQNGYELVELDRAKGPEPVVHFAADGRHVLRSENGRIWTWGIKPGIVRQQDPDETRSSTIKWHIKQHRKAIAHESWFAAEFHSTRLLSLEPDKLDRLTDRVTSRTYLNNFPGAESDLKELISKKAKFEDYVALAQIQLRQGKQSEYKETCQELNKQALHLLLQRTNYELAWTCSLSPDSGIDSQAILALLNATRLVNTPLETLPQGVPLLDSALSLLSKEPKTIGESDKDSSSQRNEFNDGVLALAYYRAGEFDLAAKHARIAASKEREKSQVHYLTLAMSLARQGDHRRAERAIESAKIWTDHYAKMNESESSLPQVRDKDWLAKRNAVLQATVIEYPILLAEAEKVLAETSAK